jgi:hypothetical protein
MHSNWDPYDKLVELDIRASLLESHVKDIQVQQIQINQRLKEQHKMIAQCNKNIETISNYINHITNLNK